MNGSLYYFTFPTRDLGRAQAFFGALFGWEFAEGGHITSIADLHGGLHAGQSSLDAKLWLHVDDVDAAVNRVRELGGEATDVQESRSGWSADCKDPGGTAFSIGRMRPEFDVGEGGSTAGPGTLGYFTLPVWNLDPAKHFYAEVFGWSYAEDAASESYAHVEGSAPACGLVTGAERAPQIWLRSTDAATSAATTRDLGGTAEEPSQSDSGWSAACTDSQGSRFNLWQPAAGL